MAKDGTFRGGARPNAGNKTQGQNSLAREFAEAGEALVAGDLPDDFDDVEYPKISDYLKAEQHDKLPLHAEKIFKATYAWLMRYGCENIVSVQLLEQYAMSAARLIQCEECISKYGLLAKHPTTKLPIASPFVSMSREYKRQVNSDWYQIYMIVRDNSVPSNSDDDEMEDLLD